MSGTAEQKRRASHLAESRRRIRELEDERRTLQSRLAEAEGRLDFYQSAAEVARKIAGGAMYEESDVWSQAWARWAEGYDLSLADLARTGQPERMADKTIRPTHLKPPPATPRRMMRCDTAEHCSHAEPHEQVYECTLSHFCQPIDEKGADV